MIDPNSSRYDAISQTVRDTVLAQWLDALVNNWTAPLTGRLPQLERALGAQASIDHPTVAIKDDRLHISCLVPAEVGGSFKYTVTLSRSEVVDLIFDSSMLRKPQTRFQGQRGAKE